MLILKKLRLVNFKKFKDFEIDFEKETKIFGRNEAGKSTIFDAYQWLLTGKNSQNETKFNFKPTGKDGAIIPNLENLVVGEFDFNGKIITIERKNKEVRKGDAVKNVTYLFFQGVPIKVGEFKAKIAEMVGGEYFRLLSNPAYFNSLPWETRREILLNLVKMPEQTTVLDRIKNGKLLGEMLDDSDLNELREQAKYQIGRLAKELKELPIRIGEVEYGKPEPLNFSQIAKEKAAKILELENVEAKIIDKSKILEVHNLTLVDKKKEIAELEMEISNSNKKDHSQFNSEKNDIESEILSAESEFKEGSEKLNKNKADLKKLQKSNLELISRIDKVGEQKSALLERYNKELNRKFNGKCQRCGNKVTALVKLKTANILFAENKAAICKPILEQGKAMKINITELENLFETQKVEANMLGDLIENSEEYLVELPLEITILRAKLEKLKYPEISELTEKLLSDAKAKKEALSKVEPPKVNTSELLSEKAELQVQIAALEKGLNVKEQIAASDKRILELKNIQKAKGTELLKIEKVNQAIFDFTKENIKIVESVLNGKFKMVTFKMFKFQNNGEEVATCQTLVNGIDYNDGLNSGHQILAGLDIIQTLSREYATAVPIFIDNCESVTSDVKLDVQTVQLFAKKGAETLEIQ